ncbi:DUF7507 domain-containing protein [Homoserinibacter sp. YIM 151385]|uniref:DUF7507 domain-containing protein n=1 Tax=Homoserinibacter sp. YIM 151385 TaxID=2985506 RepID=UPI0022F06638|nr:hypothetical protein [Homoserinibacter sp. YIM 151385]WBU37347.1 hypothetical protein OF852_10530 [Homoserinibacter sp. YIM 151385]
MLANRREWGEPGASYFTRLARAIAMVLVVVVGGFSLALVPTGAANAVVVQWGQNDGQDPSYEIDVNGDFLMAGNGVLACDSIGNQAGYGTCAQLHSANNPTGNQNANVNDAFKMVNSNTVTGFTTNSSSANLTIPQGATVVKAFLNWSANTGTYSGTTSAFCGASGFGAATLPAGSATGYQTRAIQFKVGGGSIQSYSPYQVLEDATTQSQARYYSATADVTSAFQNATTGSALTLSAGNIWAPTGTGCYAGWSATVVYDFGTYVNGNAASTPHKVVYYEGHVRQGAQDTPLTVDFNGFTAVDTGTRAGFSLYEGDRGITGDTASYRRGADTAYTEIPNSAGATGNFGIGRAAGSVRYTQTQDTSTFTNQSVDVTTTTLSRVVAGDSNVRLQLATSGDSYLLTNSILSVPTAGLKVEKTFNGTDDIQYRTANEPATFTIRLTNVGAGVLRNIQVADDQASCARTLPSGTTLAAQQSYEYTCTAAAGSATGYTSTATATARTVVGDYLAQGSDSTRVGLTAIGLTKTSSLAAGATGRVGETVNYTFVVTNRGDGPLTGVAITDPMTSSGMSAIQITWPGASGALAAGQSATGTASYVLKQSDVNSGSVVNTASATGTDSDGGTRPTATASRTQPITSAPGLSIAKTGALASGATGVVGDRINYGFTVQNTGNVTLTGVAVTDRLAGLQGLAYGTWPSGTTGTLQPGQTVTASAFYLIQQADVDAGSVKNLASVSGRTPTNTTTTASSSEVTVNTTAAAPALTTTKTASPATGAAVGSTVTYTITGRNSGNVTLTNVAVTDPMTANGLTVTNTQWPANQTAGTLAPGQQVVVTATYVVKQSDVDAGAIRNTATTSGRTPAGATITAGSGQVVTPTAAAAPRIQLTKTGTLAAGATGRAGDAVSYSFRIENTGNVTLTGVGASDPMSGLSAIAFPTAASGWQSGTVGTLRPGDVVTGTASYALKQSDVDAGSVINTATATGKPPTGANVTGSGTSTLPIAPTGTLTVKKTGAVVGSNAGVGGTVRFDFEIENTGNVTLSQIALTDSLPGLSTPSLTWQGGTAGTLAPGGKATGSATYTIRQTDVDRGTVLNTATVVGRTPAGASTPTATSGQISVSTVTRAPDMTLVKTGTRAGGAAGNAGDVVNYTFTIANTGNTTLTGVGVTDPMTANGLSTPTIPAASWASGTVGTLRPGDSVVATANYTIKQSDVNAGSISNTATATSTTSSGATLTRTSTANTPTVARSAVIGLTQTGALPQGSTGKAGDVVTWSFVATNNGTTTLSGVVIQPTLQGISTVSYGTWPSGTAGTLQPGQSVTATATYVVTQSDVDSGSVVDPATVRGTPPAGVTPSPATASAPATVPLTPRGSLSIVKSGALRTAGQGGLGNPVDYSFVVTNTGNLTLTEVVVADPKTANGMTAPTVPANGWPSGTAGTLRPGDSVTATASYPIRQADLDAGEVRNQARVEGRTQSGATIRSDSNEVVTGTNAANPRLTTTKTASTAGPVQLGQQITFTIVGRNTGNVTLSSVDVVDSLAGQGFAVTSTTWSAGQASAGTLAPDATVTVVGAYTVRQADVDAGAVTNTGTTRGSFGTANVQGAATIAVPTQQAAPSLELVKTGTRVQTGTPAVGDRIDYRFTLRNTGNVTLTTAQIADPMTDLQDFAYVGANRTLAPNQTLEATAFYIVKQSDIDAGAVVNTASASAAPPTGARIATSTPQTVPLASNGALEFDKASAYRPGTGTGPGTVGSVIRYTFTATNTGNVTLTGVGVTDPRAGLGTIAYSGWQTPNTLRVGETVTGVADYTVTQADVNAGVVANTATASGRTPGGTPVSATDTERRDTVTPAPAVTTTKTAAVSGAGGVGDTITYTIVAENTGNTTLTGVTVADPMFTASQLSYGTWPSGVAGTLQPSQSVTATAVKIITQADVDAGTVQNTATTTARTPSGGSTEGSSGPITTAVQPARPSIDLVQTGALPSGSPGRAGETVTFTFTLTNDGNVTLSGTQEVTRSLPGISPIAYGAWPSGTVGQLRPGDTVTGTATYTLTQADVDSGAIQDVASVTGTSARGNASDTDTATVPINRGPAIVLEKTGQLTESGEGGVGSTITYRFTLTNTGTVTLRDAFVADPLLAAADVAVQYGTWASGTAGTLRPGDVVTGAAVYTITQDDFDRGRVTNTASVDASGPAGTPNATSTTRPVVVATGDTRPMIEIGKTAVVSGARGVGDTITYTFTVVNTGNVNLTDVEVSDIELEGLGPVTYSPSWPGGPDAPRSLGPNGGTGTATATYTITQEDVDRGIVTNRALVSAQTVGGEVVDDVSPQVITTLQAKDPVVSVLKQGVVRGGGTAALGSIVDYTITVSNGGNQTLSNVTLSDPLLADLSRTTFGTIRPGDAPLTATGTYRITQADVDAGSVLNVATARADTPNGGAPVTGQGADTRPVPSTSSIGLVKSADFVEGSGGVGSIVRYTFVAENTGTTTLRVVQVQDELPSLSELEYGAWPTGTAGVLPPGETVTATATYEVRQADVDAGAIENTARVGATTPGGTRLDEPSNTLTTGLAPADPELTVTKTADAPERPALGDVIRFRISVANTGNITVDGVELADRLQGLGELSLTWPGAEGVLAPGEELVATAEYVVTQADIDAGSVSNDAVATGVDRRDGDEVTGEGSVRVETQTRRATIQVVDSGALAPAATGRAGDETIWTYVVENTGNVTLEGVTVTESALAITGGYRYGAWPDADRPGRLLPGQRVTVRATHLLTQAEADAGVVRSTVTTAGSPASGPDATDDDRAELPIDIEPELTAVKSGSYISGAGELGSTIRYRLEITNTGNVTLYRGTLVDPMEGLRDLVIQWPDPERVGYVPVGATVVGTALYDLQPKDLDEGRIENTASVGAFTSPTPGEGVETGSDSNTVVIVTEQAASRIQTTVQGAARGDAGRGDIIDWEIRLENTGNVTVTDAELDWGGFPLEDVRTTWPGTPGSLAAGAVLIVRGTSLVTQADVDAGSVVLAATGTGAAVRGTGPAPSTAAGTVPTVGSSPTLVIEKVARADGASEQGDLVTWEYTLTNEGNVTLTGVTLADQLPMVDGVAYTWPAGQPAGQLAPGATVTGTAQYRLTQADVDRGSVRSAVVGRGTPPRGATLVVQDADGVTIAARPAATVVKEGTSAGSGELGSLVDYEFAVENTGNVTLTLVDLEDQLVGVTAPDMQWPGTPGTLEPGARLTATAEYRVTQADLDRGYIANTAVARGKPPVGDLMEWSTSEVRTTVAAARPAIAVSKASTPAGGATLGQTISYRIAVQNTGNVTVGDIDVRDVLPGRTDLVTTWPDGVTDETLRPGQTLYVDTTYRVTQADVDAGEVVNTVDATAVGVRAAPGGDATAEGSDTVVTSVVGQTASIAVTDRGTLAPGATGRAGDALVWTYIVRNTGTTTLTGLEITERLPLSGELEYSAWPDPARPFRLAPGTEVTVTARTILTQAQADAGEAISAVGVVGTPPRGDDVDDEATARVEITPQRALDVVKTGAYAAGGRGRVGDEVDYRLEVTNTGNVSLYGGRLVDPMPHLGPLTVVWPDPARPGYVPVGGVVVGTAQYTIQPEDIDAGQIENRAHVAGYSSPDLTPATRVDAYSDEIVIPTVEPSTQLAAAIRGVRSGTGIVGDTVEWTITVRNDSNVTVSAMDVDRGLALTDESVTWQGGIPGTLAAGATVTYRGTTTITQADVDRGSVPNRVVATGVPARGPDSVTSNTAETSVPTRAAAPAISVRASGAVTSGDGREGSIVTFTYLVKNEGNVTLDPTTVEDATAGVGSPVYPGGTPPRLAPGAEATITATYTVTQADVDAGSVSSLVTATGTPPVGADATASAPATVPLAGSSSLRVEKTGALRVAGADRVGDTIDYRIEMFNEGTLTLREVELTDALDGLTVPRITWPEGVEGVIPPGRSAVATASYQIAQKDVDAGEVLNTATVAATDARGDDQLAVSPQSRIATAAAAPAYTVAKSGSVVAPGTGVAGDQVRWTFRIENTGNVSLSAIDLTEQLAGASKPTVVYPAGAASLAPRAVATATATYRLTQTDVDRGSVVNWVSATARTPGGATVTQESNRYRLVPAAAAPAIAVSQRATTDPLFAGKLGDPVEFEFVLRNTGNVTLTDPAYRASVVGLEDPTLTWSGVEGQLDPNGTLTVRGTHRVTQAEVDAGRVVNELRGTGRAPGGGLVTGGPTTETVPLDAPVSRIGLTKTAEPATGAKAGDRVTFTLTLANTGEATVRDARMADTMEDLGALEMGRWPTDAEGVLAPGQDVTATAVYRVTQADIDRGSIANSATADASGFGGTPVTQAAASITVPLATRAPAITLTKTQTLPSGSTGKVGDRVSYAFTVKNTGTVTLDDVRVADEQQRLSGIVVDWGTGAEGTLAPGREVRGTATYVLTQDDLDAGTVASDAVVTSTARGGGAPQDAASGSVDLVQRAAVELEKTRSHTAPAREGTVIAYRLVAENTGNVTLTGVELADPLPGLDGLQVTWPTAVAGVLAPGARVIGTATYTVTAADVDAGSIANTASVTGAPPASVGGTVGDTDSATVAVPNRPAIGIVMSVRIADGRAGFPGDRLQYTYVITNTGDRTLTGVRVADDHPRLGAFEYLDWPGELGVLAPGQSVTAVAYYAIIAEDAGRMVPGTSQAIGFADGGATTVTDEAQAPIALPAMPVVPGPADPTTPTTPGGLASTGTDAALSGLSALALLLSGLVIIVVGTRRRRKETA